MKSQLSLSLMFTLATGSTGCATLCPEVAMAPSPASAVTASRRCLKGKPQAPEETLKARLADNRTERVQEAAGDIFDRFFPSDEDVLALPDSRAGLRLKIERLEDAAIGASSVGDQEKADALRGRATRLRKLDKVLTEVEAP